MTLVERLRTVGKDYDFHENALIYEAADRIEELEAELAAIKNQEPSAEYLGFAGAYGHTFRLDDPDLPLHAKLYTNKIGEKE